MADAKISALTALTGANLATDDEFAVVDTSATTTKKITVNELLSGLLGGTCTFDTTYSLATAATFGWSTDLILRRAAAANLALGAADAAAPVAQTISVQSVVAGTTDTGGANLTIKASAGTGTGKTGKVIIQLGTYASGTGSAQNAHFTAFTFDATTTVPAGRSLLTMGGDYGVIETTGAVLFTQSGNFSQSFISGLQVQNDMRFSWSDDSINAASSEDTGFERSAAGVVAVTAAGAGTAGAMEFRERTAPSAPSANRVRIYAQDNGSGKTQLMALFSSGAAQQMAIEP